MKENKQKLKIFNFSHPLMDTEVLSLRGDKYRESLPFQWELVENYHDADLILWDGLITPKNRKTVMNFVKDQKFILIIGESKTLFRDHPFVELFEVDQEKHYEVAAWNVLPEEILQAFEACWKKLNHV